MENKFKFDTDKNSVTKTRLATGLQTCEQKQRLKLWPGISLEQKNK